MREILTLDAMDPLDGELVDPHSMPLAIVPKVANPAVGICL